MSLVIAIDGPAGSGKSSLAKRLADEFGLNQVDSGALYRTFTYLGLQYCQTNQISLNQALPSDSFQSFLKQETIDISFDENRHQVIKAQERDLEPFIRTPEITSNIKAIADAPFIRQLVNSRLRQLAENFSLVADGRDMGTEVFTEADIKFFITASLAERAKRRYKEFSEQFGQITLNEVEKQIAQRDKEDENRPLGALKRASDAILIDTTSQNLEAAFRTIENHLSASKSTKISNLIKNKKNS